jgi:hypothetical protein
MIGLLELISRTSLARGYCWDTGQRPHDEGPRRHRAHWALLILKGHMLKAMSRRCLGAIGHS